ncbi:LIM domain only protein 3-like isoform X2 [Microplitis mediator]|uniref:LIM domain only protein 3-like isoform X2 n=1 Tax=Microplitis mediator TaxID=375433 RepID=UPI002556F2D1|nr:LIM domain only protein 3-like isoform X2 [Microplitis mediator]
MTMDVSKSEPNKSGSTPQECAGCGKAITERYLLKALDMFWHEDCLKCGCCDCRLGEVGSTLYTKANLILCKRDYLRLFGNTGYCSACSKVIPAFEMVMRARTNVYHLECFACQQCNHRFCVGDRFYLCENKILCEYDYEERLVFANMALHPPPTATLAHIKRQSKKNNTKGVTLRMPGELELVTKCKVPGTISVAESARGVKVLKNHQVPDVLVLIRDSKLGARVYQED